MNGTLDYVDKSGQLVSVDTIKTTNISKICGTNSTGTQREVTIYALHCPCAREANITKECNDVNGSSLDSISVRMFLPLLDC